MIAPEQELTVPEISRAEAEQVIDDAARRYLHISGEQFVHDYESGVFAGSPDLAHKVSCVSILLPLLTR
jgi:hypothetical protein